MSKFSHKDLIWAAVVATMLAVAAVSQPEIRGLICRQQHVEPAAASSRASPVGADELELLGESLRLGGQLNGYTHAAVQQQTVDGYRQAAEDIRRTLPAWDRLTIRAAELAGISGPRQRFAALLTDYMHLRTEHAHNMLELMEEPDSQSIKDRASRTAAKIEDKLNELSTVLNRQ